MKNTAPSRVIRSRSAFRLKKTPADLVMLAIAGCAFVFLLVCFVLPLMSVMSNSVRDSTDKFVGLENYEAYFRSARAVQLIVHSVSVATVASITTLCMATILAAAIYRSRIRGKAIFHAIALAPMLAPSLLPALAAVRLFGNQGFAKGLLGDHSIYGPIGIVLCDVFYTFPPAFLLVSAAFQGIDGRLYEAAYSLRANSVRTFFTVTLPSIRYGLVCALCVVFTMNITDFGVPQVVGGDFSVFATEVYKQVVGQQNFQLGAVVSAALLFPSIMSFVVTRWTSTERQISGVTRIPLQIPVSKSRDAAALTYCSLVSLFILGIFFTAGFAAFVKFWPYDLSLTWSNFDFNRKTDIGWTAIFNSIRMALLAAVFGTALTLATAYALERAVLPKWLTSIVQGASFLPSAVPGLVLGLGYLAFFNERHNPLSVLYGTTTIMVLCTIVHFYTVSVSTFQTAFKKIDANLEFVSASLRVGRFVLHKRVTLPLMMTTISEVFVYFFISGMTTTSAIIMIYYPSTVTATIGIIGLNDNGAIAPAMAMGVLIVAVNIFARILQALARWYFAWNQRRVSSVERLDRLSSINGIGSTAVKLMRRSQ